MQLTKLENIIRRKFYSNYRKIQISTLGIRQNHKS